MLIRSCGSPDSFTTVGLLAVLQYGHNLTELTLASHEKLSLTESDLDSDAVYSGLPKLANLYFTMCLANTDETVCLVTKNCTNLVNLDLHLCPELTDKCLEHIAMHNHKLQMVNFAMDMKIGDDGLLAVSRHCPDFEGGNLNFTTVTDRGITALAQNCKKLARLTLKHNEGITNESIEALTQHSPQFTSLDLGTVNPQMAGGLLGEVVLGAGPDVVSPVTNSALSAFVLNCTAIHALDLSDCCDIDSTVKLVAERCPLLKWLVLTKGGNVTEDTMISIAEACPKIAFLDVQKCVCITDRSLCSLVEHCTALTSLDVSHCDCITDKSLMKIADHSSELNELSVNWCHKLTANAIVEVTAQCPRILKLHCLNIPHSYQILTSVVVNCPFLADLAVSDDVSVTRAAYERACKDIDNVFPRAVLCCMGIVPQGMLPPQ
eukprot:gene22316-28434_t